MLLFSQFYQYTSIFSSLLEQSVDAIQFKHKLGTCTCLCRKMQERMALREKVQRETQERNEQATRALLEQTQNQNQPVQYSDSQHQQPFQHQYQSQQGWTFFTTKYTTFPRIHMEQCLHIIRLFFRLSEFRPEACERRWFRQQWERVAWRGSRWVHLSRTRRVDCTARLQ